MKRNKPRLNLQSIILFILSISISCLLLIACSNNTETTTAPNDNKTDPDPVKNEPADQDEDEVENKEPVTIRIGWIMQGDEYWEVFENDLKEAYPYITVERVDGQPTDNREALEEWILGNQIPDIVSLTTNNFELFAELELAYDLSELIEKAGYDLSRFVERNIDHIRMYSINNGIQALPFMAPRNTMFYNTEIFDMVGVPYPEPGMTWEEAIDLARSLTFERDGVQYRGFDIGEQYIGQFLTLDTPVLDAETHEPTLLTNPIWREALEIAKEMYSIPGMFKGDEHFYWDNNWQGFVGEQVVAMTPHPFAVWNISDAHENFKTWRITTIPEHEGMPGMAGGGAWTMGISSTSEHKEAAFEVLKFLLSDEQLVKYYSLTGDVSRFPLDDPTLREQVDAHPVFENVDYDIFFSQEFAAPIPRSPYETEINRNAIFVDYIKSDVDINTYLRETQEKISKLVEDLKGRN